MNILLLPLLLFSALHAATIIEDQCGLTIESPALKERQTRKMRLDNGMEVFLISDPGAAQAAAALSVHVGSFDDPNERPGMAHFVEHMLFLGTEKYPEEDGYTRCLDAHAGQRNAFTANDRTVYFFSANHSGFEEALDRFSQFFIAPLFSPSGVSRECTAIHQEYCKNVPLDAWRLQHVKKEQATPEHPFHNFSIGNLTTLARISQDELKAWYHTHYGAQLMHLVVLSKEPLDILTTHVETLFANVPTTPFTPQKNLPPLFSKATEGTLTAVVPLQQVQDLELVWEIPEQDKEVRADLILSHLIGYEGPGSLLSLLKQTQLAYGLSAGSDPIGHEQHLLTITVHLTDRGLAHYEEVIAYCFQALASYRIRGIPKTVFDEITQIKTLQYAYQSRASTASFVAEMASGLIDEPLDTFPRKSLMPTRYDAAALKSLLTALTPETCHFSLMAPPQKGPLAPHLEEPWMRVAYAVQPLPPQKLFSWGFIAPHPAIFVPHTNMYLPQNMALVSESAEKTEPLLLEKSDQGCCYLCTDHTFRLPQIAWQFTLKTPLITAKDVKSHVLADLFCYTVTQRLIHASYDAALGGLDFTLSPAFNGLSLTVNGFHDKAPLFLAKILEALTTTEPTRQEFEAYCALLQREYANHATRSPFHQAYELTWSAIYQHFPDTAQKQHLLKTLSYGDMKRFTQGLWKKSYVEAMLYGNLTQETAQEVWVSLKDHLCHQPYPEKAHFCPSVISLKDSHILEFPSSLPGNALILVADFGPFSLQKCAALDVLCSALETPFFSELRTIQQTAYLIHHWYELREGHLYAFFAVQSSSHESRDLLARFELFLESSLRNFETEIVPQARFEAIRKGAIEKLRHPAENITKMGNILYELAFVHHVDFSWLEQQIAALEALTYQECVACAHTYLGTQTPRRLAICVHGILPQDHGLHYKHIPSCDVLRTQFDYMPLHSH